MDPNQIEELYPIAVLIDELKVPYPSNLDLEADSGSTMTSS
jgi:hypothetical protein